MFSPSAFLPLGHASAHPLTYLNRRPLASSLLPAVMTKPFSLDTIAPSSPVVQNTLHTAVDATLPASTPFPVPASTSPGIDDGSSLTSTPQIDPSPVLFGGDAPGNGADSGLLDAVSPAAPTPTGGQPPSQGINASTPNIGPGSLTSALPPGEIGISTITAPAVAAISTTDSTSIPISVIPGYVVIIFFLHTSDDRISYVSQIDFNSQAQDHNHHDHDDDDKKTSSFTTTTTFTTYSTTEIAGRPTSILTTETSTVFGSTLVPVHLHKSPNRLETPNPGLAQLDDDIPLTALF